MCQWNECRCNKKVRAKNLGLGGTQVRFLHLALTPIFYHLRRRFFFFAAVFAILPGDESFVVCPIGFAVPGCAKLLVEENVNVAAERLLDRMRPTANHVLRAFLLVQFSNCDSFAFDEYAGALLLWLAVKINSPALVLGDEMVSLLQIEKQLRKARVGDREDKKLS